MDEFIDKVVLITGAGRGAGRAAAVAFASMGAIVAANDINPLNLDDTVSQILQSDGKARSYVFDIAKRMPIEAMVAQVLEHYGQIDYLVNHAAVRPDASLLEMDEWEFHRTLDVNLGGIFFMIQQVGRVMRQQGGGAIVNLIGLPAETAMQKGHAAVYASLAGVIGLTHSAARELSEYNIRVNSVCQGHIDVGQFPSRGWDSPAYQHWLESALLARLGHYPDLVSKVVFLCSQAASNLTGQVLTAEPSR